METEKSDVLDLERSSVKLHRIVHKVIQGAITATSIVRES